PAQCPPICAPHQRLIRKYRGNKLELRLARLGTGISSGMRSRSAMGEAFTQAAGALARCCALTLVAAALAACSLFDKDQIVPDEPADKLYNEGLYLLNQKKDPKDAAKKFEEVDRQHPYSEWARKSLIMTAYAYYQAGQYDECINSARRYITLHPGSSDAAYAQFLIGSSYFD